MYLRFGLLPSAGTLIAPIRATIFAQGLLALFLIKKVHVQLALHFEPIFPLSCFGLIADGSLLIAPIKTTGSRK